MDIIVFPDGETFNTVDGCSLQEVEDGLDTEGVERALENEQGLLVAWVTDLLTAGDVVKVAATLLEPSEIDLNPEYFRALAELCNRVQGRSGDERERTEAELRRAAERQ